MPKNTEELKEMYSELFANLDYLRILESHVKVMPLNNDFAYCVWQGKEEIKMIESEEIQSTWTATIIASKLNDDWKIIHFHATHYFPLQNKLKRVVKTGTIGSHLKS